jgi:hypothetical protein
MEQRGTVNPYVATGLAMCGVLLVALIGTAYLAVYFNRRAKADLERLMTPLAELINGEVDLDEAEVKGSYEGNLVMARMANAAAGTVRLFQIDMIDAAGGFGWNYIYSRPRKEETAPRVEFESTRMDIRTQLAPLAENRLVPLNPNATDWIQLEYSPDTGHVRFARPMKSRNEIPDVATFQKSLRYLLELANENRAAQEQLRSIVEDSRP